MSEIPSDSILARQRWRPAEYAWWAVAIGAWFVFPDDLALGTSVLVTVMYVLSYDILAGFAGVLSFCHTVFFGLGAFVAAWLSLAGWTEPISAVLLGGIAAGLLAALVGPFVLRLKGLPLLMVTLALGVMVFEAAAKATRLTGGDDGLTGIRIAPLFGLFHWGLGGKTQYLYALGWLFIVYWLLRRLSASPFGVILQGIRENPVRMRLSGNALLPHLTASLAISAGFAGMAGAVFTQTTAFVSLGVLSVDNSISVLVMLVLGGIGSLYGALIGAPLYMLLKHFTSQWSPFYWMFVIGGLLVFVVLAGQGGMVGLLARTSRRLGRREPG
jgi:branched-chain amino acid transport system permease protein